MGSTNYNYDQSRARLFISPAFHDLQTSNGMMKISMFEAWRSIAGEVASQTVLRNVCQELRSIV